MGILRLAVPKLAEFTFPVQFVTCPETDRLWDTVPSVPKRVVFETAQRVRDEVAGNDVLENRCSGNVSSSQ
jgi:hypothetical protein